MGDWGSPQKGWNLNGSVACKFLDRDDFML